MNFLANHRSEEALVQLPGKWPVAPEPKLTKLPCIFGLLHRIFNIMVSRDGDFGQVFRLLERHRAVGVIGARQTGKSTLAREILASWPDGGEFFDLENPEDLARLADPMLGLQSLRGLVVIDEVQRRPELFSILRVLVDRKPLPARFLILGSASPSLLRQSSESLAGRIVYYELGGFRLEDVGIHALERLWVRGGLPESFLGDTERGSFEWRSGYVRTFLERDLPQLGIGVGAETMRRFWMMLAHWHGQVWNGSEFARSFGVADTTVRAYLDHLSSALVVRLLLPWHENLAKRQVKSPKVYIADSGLLHGLLNQPTLRDLEAHPKLGASWEGFLIDQLGRHLKVRPQECYFWATHAGAELDLLVVRGRHRVGFEFKRTVSPKVTPSMRTAIKDLRLERIDVIHAGEKSFPMTEHIRAVSAMSLLEEIPPME